MTFAMDFNAKDFKEMRETRLEDLATIHPLVTKAADLFEKLRSFDDTAWTFRGQGEDWPLTATIERYAIRPGVAEDYVMREFRRRVHHYSTTAPHRDDDLEWLALMQHHRAPTRLLDWTRSAQIAAFFAAQSSAPFVRKMPKSVPSFTIWAVDKDAVNAEAKKMLGLTCDTDVSSHEVFCKIFWSQPTDDLYLVMAVEPYRLNERLTIQQGLFLLGNNVQFSFHNCLVNLLLHAKKHGRPSNGWLHKIEVAPGARADVLRTLDKVNINSATLFPGLDGFCESLQVAVQIQESDVWPGIALAEDREKWVKGI
jgi:hypothetical protein